MRHGTADSVVIRVTCNTTKSVREKSKKKSSAKVEWNANAHTIIEMGKHLSVVTSDSWLTLTMGKVT